MRALKQLWADLWAQLAELYSGREWFLGLGMLVVICLWLSLGSPAFFSQQLAPRLALGPWADWLQYLWYHAWALVLLALLPLAVLWRFFGIGPRRVGVCLGDWRWGLRFVGLGILVTTPFIVLSSFDPAFQAEYPLTQLAGRSLGSWVLWELTYLLYYLGWEICFRGVLLFGLQERLGTGGALLFQTAISTLVHLGKPLGELLGAAPAGLLFGAAALRSGSVFWPLLLHFWLGASMDICAFYSRSGLLG